MTTRRRTSIWAIGYLIGPMIIALDRHRSIVDNSYLWHIRAGDEQRRLGSVLTEDPFSYTALGEPWRTQSWLPDLWYSWGVETLGSRFSQWIVPVVGTLLFVVLAAIARSRAATGPATAIVMGSSVVLLLAFLQPRPVVLSYLLFALTVLAAQRPRLYWTVPLIMLVWAGTHGSFVLGFVVLATSWWTDRNNRIALAGVASLATVNLTGHGVMIWTILFDFGQSRTALDRISEWAPPDLLQVMFIPVVAGIALVVARAARSELGHRELIPALAWFVFGLTATRSMPMLWIAMLPLLTTLLSSALSTVRTSASMPTWSAYLIGCCMVALPLAVPADEVLSPERFPLAAAEQLTDERVFHDDVIGGYLIYAQWPERLVYIDDRAELFRDRLVAMADAKIGSEEWRSTLNASGATQALVRRSDALASLLREAPDWELVHEDPDFLVFDRIG